MTSVTFTKAEYDALSSMTASKYMDWSNEEEHADYEIEERDALLNLGKKMLKARNRKGTWYLYQLIDSEGGIVRENILPEYLGNWV